MGGVRREEWIWIRWNMDGINELARWKKLFVEAAMMGYLAGK